MSFLAAQYKLSASCANYEILKNMPLRELNYAKALAHAAVHADADCAVEGLFPDSPLEVLLSRDLEVESRSPSLPPLPVKVELAAMRAIGQAIVREMGETGTKLLTLRVDGYGEIVVFQPEIRETVLLGTRTTLLNA